MLNQLTSLLGIAQKTQQLGTKTPDSTPDSRGEDFAKVFAELTDTEGESVAADTGTADTASGDTGSVSDAEEETTTEEDHGLALDDSPDEPDLDGFVDLADLPIPAATVPDAQLPGSEVPASKLPGEPVPGETQLLTGRTDRVNAKRADTGVLGFETSAFSRSGLGTRTITAETTVTGFGPGPQTRLAPAPQTRLARPDLGSAIDIRQDGASAPGSSGTTLPVFSADRLAVNVATRMGGPGTTPRDSVTLGTVTPYAASAAAQVPVTDAAQTILDEGEAVPHTGQSFRSAGLAVPQAGITVAPTGSNRADSTPVGVALSEPDFPPANMDEMSDLPNDLPNDLNGFGRNATRGERAPAPVEAARSGAMPNGNGTPLPVFVSSRRGMRYQAEDTRAEIRAEGAPSAPAMVVGQPVSTPQPPPVAPLPASDMAVLPDNLSGAWAPADLDEGDQEGDLAFGSGVRIIQGHHTAASAPTTFQPNRADVSAVLRQVAEGFSRVTEGTVELRLNPEELGRVRMFLVSGEHGLTVNILADRPETLDLMRRNVDELARNLAEAGYEGAGFTFGEDRPSEGGGTARRGDPGDVPEPDIELKPTAGMRLSPVDGLDIRI